MTSYSAAVQRSLQVLDAAQINPDLIEALLAHIVEQMARKGPGALLQVRGGEAGMTGENGPGGKGGGGGMGPQGCAAA